MSAPVCLHDGRGRYREPNAWQLGRLRWERTLWRCVVTIDGDAEGTEQWVLAVDGDDRAQVEAAGVAHGWSKHCGDWKITAEASLWPIKDGKPVPMVNAAIFRPHHVAPKARPA